MGRATVVSGGTDGLYQVRMDYGTAQRDARVAALDQQLAALAADLVQWQARVAELEPAVAAAVAQLAVMEQDYVAVAQDASATAKARQGALKAWTDAAATLARAQALLAPARVEVERIEAEQAVVQRERAAWLGLQLEGTRSAWCVDLTEDATGEVATLEIPGEPGTVVLAPAARAPADDDGAVVAREVMSPAQVFFNAAILPGWQKFMPTYRKGTITALDQEGNTATVEFGTATSSAQGLEVNRYPVLEGVPVEYMDCHAHAFEVGDRCVVAFADQSWSFPKVVGFVDHPRSCFPKWVYLPLKAGRAPGGWHATGPDEAVHAGLMYNPDNTNFALGWLGAEQALYIRPGYRDVGVFFRGDWYLTDDKEPPPALQVLPDWDVAVAAWRCQARPYEQLDVVNGGAVAGFTLAQPVDFSVDLGGPAGGLTVTRTTYQFTDVSAVWYGANLYPTPVPWTKFIGGLTGIGEADVPYLGLSAPFYTTEAVVEGATGGAMAAVFAAAGAPEVKVQMGSRQALYTLDGVEWHTQRGVWQAKYKRPANPPAGV